MECQYDATTVANLYCEYIVCGKAWSHCVYVIYIGMPVNFVEINVTNARIPRHIPKATTLKYLCLFCAKEFHLHSNCTFIASGLCLWEFLFSNFVSKNKYPNAFYAFLFTRFDVIYWRFAPIQRCFEINISDSNSLTDVL